MCCSSVFGGGHVSHTKSEGAGRLHKDNASAIRRLAFSLAIVLAALSPGATAVIVEVVGTNGSFGVSGGDGDPGTDGLDGSDGESISATASSADATNRATASGGNGGAGGNGGDGQPAGANGGDGGDAGSGGDAIATAEVVVSSGAALSIADSEGGDGNAGGLAGDASIGGAFGNDGTGGDGGSAASSASALNTGSDSVRVIAVAKAGNGQRSGGSRGCCASTDGVGDSDGGSPGDVTFGPVSGVSTGGGDVEVELQAFGGDGGNATGSGRPGDGGSVELTNAVDGDTAAELRLTQEVFGGDGGLGELNAGRAGTGGSTLNLTKSAEMLILSTVATGGDAGHSVSGAAIKGGDATANTTAENEAGHAVAETHASGGRGSEGGDATSRASAVTRADGSTATADGFARGGSGGAPGSADSMSKAVAHGDGSARALDEARGAIGGTGQDGGASTSHAFASNSGDSFDVLARAFAIGGRGGSSLTDGKAGTGGTAQATARGVSTDGADVVVSAVQEGGVGGTSFQDSDGGDGANSAMVDAVSGSTAGELVLFQRARGGDARSGQTGFGLSPRLSGTAGSAESRLTANNLASGELVGLSEAIGGVGARAPAGGVATDGGDAVASIHLTGVADVTATAEARGNFGGSSSNTSTSTGAGGNAMLDGVFAESTSGAAVIVRGIAEGGSAGGNATDGANGGIGRSITLMDEVDGKTIGALRLEQFALGGDGSRSLRDGAQPGAAGDASSSLSKTSSSTSLTILTQSEGGLGSRHSLSTGLPGSEGGLAESLSVAVNLRGDSDAIANSIGGDARNNIGGGAHAQALSESPEHSSATATSTAGDGSFHGRASALANAIGKTSKARALATGRSGNVVATAVRPNDSGIVRTASAQSETAALSSSSIVESSISTSDPEPLPTDANSVVHATIGPTKTFVSSLVSGSPIVAAKFEGADVDHIAAIAFSAASSFDSPTEVRLRSTAKFGLRRTVVQEQQDIFAGVVETSALTSGFSQLDFSVEREGTIVVHETFLDAVSALSFFDNLVIDLAGPDTAIPSDGILDLMFALDVKVDGSNQGFEMKVVLGQSSLSGTVSAPEPRTAFLMIAALVLLSAGRAIRLFVKGVPRPYRKARYADIG